MRRNERDETEMEIDEHANIWKRMHEMICEWAMHLLWILSPYFYFIS